MALTASHQVSGTYQPSNNDNIWVVTESSTGIDGLTLILNFFAMSRTQAVLY
jgi:hypothetical protein